MRRFIINVNGKSYDVSVEEVDAAASAPVSRWAMQSLSLYSVRENSPLSPIVSLICSAVRPLNSGH